MVKQDASKAAAEGSAVLRPSKAAARVLKILRPAENVRATPQFRSPIETDCGANREAPLQSQREASRAAAESCAVLRPSKAAATVLRVLRPAQNVPRSSFEAQWKQFVGPIGRHPFLCVAFQRVCGLESYSRTSGESNQSVSNIKNAAIPTEPRERLANRRQHHAKASRTLRELLRRVCGAEAFESCCEVLRVLRSVQTCFFPSNAFMASAGLLYAFNRSKR